MAIPMADTRAWAARARAALLLPAAAAGLAACNPQDRQPTARLEPGYGFFFNQDEDSASLAYGRADSDEVGLMLQCRKGSRQVQVSDLAGRATGAGAVLILASGGTRSALKAAVTPDAESGRPLASAEAPETLPALAAFRRSGRLSVTLAGRQEAMAASPAEQAGVARFFAACERSAR